MNRFINWCARNYQSLLVALLGLLAFMLFEARQQLFYAENFNNGVPNTDSFWSLFKAGLYRWTIWIALSIPMVLFFLKYRIKKINGANLMLTAGIILMFTVLNVAVVAGRNTLMIDSSSSLAFAEFFKFYFYHKAPVILGANAFLVVMIHFFLNQEDLQLSIQELGSLKYSNQKLYSEQKKDLADHEMVIQVKIGMKLKLVPVETIVWIEADDYCVKLHDNKGASYTMRSSLKAFEERLPESTFVRVHRKAIVNMNTVKEIDLANSPTVILEDGSRVPVAQSRLKNFKNQLQPA